MEMVLDLYHQPYDPARPVVCFDEKPCQLRGHVRDPLPMRPATETAAGRVPARPQREDHEYLRKGTANVLLAVEPLTGRRQLWVRPKRRKIEFAEVAWKLVEEVYPEAERIRLVCDNLNTHTAAAFYERFDPETARMLTRKVEFIYTPKHGSWLNVAEIDLSALGRQCLDRRIESLERLTVEAAAWEGDRNQKATPIRWQFTTEAARIKLHRLYPEYLSE